MRAILSLLAIVLIVTSCATPKGKEALSEDFTIIEGHLAAKPMLERGGKRLIIYIGDRTIPEEKPPPLTDALTGEEIEKPGEFIDPEGGKEHVNVIPDLVENQPRLTNLRKAVTENDEEKWVLQQLKTLMAGCQGPPSCQPEDKQPGLKIGPEGPTIRLYGKYIKGKRWQEHVGGIDFVFCFLGYNDLVTGEDTVIDTCFGDRWQDDFFKFIFEKGKGGVKAIPKAIF